MFSQQPHLLCHYGYDPLDRLINHAQPDTPTLQRFYCKSRLASEIQGAMQHSILQHDDHLLAQQRRKGVVSINALLATDQQRSVLHTLDENPAPQTIAYSPYGHRRGESGVISLLGFNGESPDPVTGHYLLGNGYRAFNPVLMRFNSPDDLSPFGRGGFNPYTYCLGDPVNRYDPTGHVSTGIMRLMDLFGAKVSREFRLRVTPGAGFTRATELADVAKNMQVTYTAGKRGPQVLRLKDPLMTPEDALKRRDEIINLNFTKKRNRKNDFYFEQMDEAVKAGNKGRIQFLKDIGSEKAYKAFDGKKVEAIKEVPVEYVTAATAERSRYAREFETALSDQIGKALDDVRSDAWEIRNKHFYS